ncbi:nicotinamide mononucleotide transporter PnuC [Enterococcus silesiacus]|uniref:Nicotinamide mononucleotide transporter PnuC n=1 Tax=Enterococcus silesiacus TaxID=332949 RepID=A0A0S3KAN2_9ENTE|nr:nicotinamide riboside transporter PnuC [Enterococcus silesiacus]ALS01377.1 nicotinamide mononucleotide transporter PnuC [Enterococcus silesiacus]OJG88574.1 nicotinamide mononucleotide transporter PnuC [Enterococcus silesiacus]
MSSNFILNDFKGWERKNYLFLFTMIGVQLVGFLFNPSSWITLVGGLSGIICVNLIAQGRVSNYIFGFISALIIGYFGFKSRVYAEVLLQSFYIIMDITGLYTWLKVSEDGSGNVTDVKTLKGIQWLYAGLVWLSIGMAAYYLLGFVNDAQQTLDAVTFSVSATAMLLMIKRYQSQFVFWLLGNIFSLVLWFRAGTHAGGDYALFVMYSMYTINSIYGMIHWLKLKK